MFSPRAPSWFTTILIFSVLFLQGCTTAADNQAAAQRASAAREQQSRALAQQINQRCAGYGFQPGTTAFAQCLQKEAHQAEAIDQGQTMLMMQAAQQSARDQQEHFRRAQCYATGRLDCL